MFRLCAILAAAPGRLRSLKRMHSTPLIYRNKPAAICYRNCATTSAIGCTTQVPRRSRRRGRRSGTLFIFGATILAETDNKTVSVTTVTKSARFGKVCTRGWVSFQPSTSASVTAVEGGMLGRTTSLSLLAELLGATAMLLGKSLH